MTVAPTETTDYVAIMERGGEPTIMSTRLIVRGSKGAESDWPTPLFSAYLVPIRESSALKLVDLASRVRKILQETFDVQQMSDDGKFDFYTAFAERSDLTSADERPPSETPNRFPGGTLKTCGSQGRDRGEGSDSI